MSHHRPLPSPRLIEPAERAKRRLAAVPRARRGRAQSPPVGGEAAAAVAAGAGQRTALRALSSAGAR